MRQFTQLLASGFILAVAIPTAALADMPAHVKAMLDAAAAKDGATLSTIASVAKTTNPDASADIDAYVSAYTKGQEDARIAKLDSQSFLEGWTGQGDIGVSFSSGSSKTTDIYAGIGLTKESLKWRHSINALADLQKSDGTKNREKFGVTLQSSYKFNDRLFAYGLLGWERDPFQGYSRRFTESLGIGYRVIAADNITWDIEGGPALRQTTLVGPKPLFAPIPKPNGKQNVLAGRIASNFMYKFSDKLVFTNASGGLFNKGSDSLYARSLLSASLTDRINAGIGFDVTIETKDARTLKPKQTDTTTRLTLGYKF
jgi:putative salt-induced outer membrane protein